MIAGGGLCPNVSGTFILPLAALVGAGDAEKIAASTRAAVESGHDEDHSLGCAYEVISDMLKRTARPARRLPQEPA